MRLKFFYIIIVIFCSTTIFAQQSFHVKIIPIDSSNSLFTTIPLNNDFSSSQKSYDYIKQLPVTLAARGFISASVDSVGKDTANALVYLFLGKKYKWQHIKLRTNDSPLLQQLGIDSSNFDNQIIINPPFENTFNTILNYYLDNGYPFAKISLDSVNINNDAVSAVLNIDKGFLYKMDSIHVEGSAKVSEDFLHRYLNITNGEIYNQQKLQSVDKQLQNLQYVQITHPSDVKMLNQGAVLDLYIDKKPTNEIDAILGFQPKNGETGGKLQLTGQVNLNLSNAFGNGENIGINWQQLQPQSPRIDLQFQKPYLFKSPFGLDFSFNLYKQDSAYVTVNGNIGTTYQLSQNQTGKVFVNFASSHLLYVDTLQIISTKQLPAIIDESAINIGFGYTFNNTDYKYNPRRGNELSATVLVGNKHVQKNNTITQIHADTFDYASLYDTVPLKGYQIKIQTNAAHYFQLGKFSVLKLGVNAGLYQSPSIYTNEMFMLGGYQLLRGFDAQSIYANAYAVGTLEYRYLVARNSFFFVFSDFGGSQFKNNSTKYNDGFLSFGFGMAFETKAGIFNFNLASGKDRNNNFGLNNAKVNIAYTALF
ncbi:hypothetical protein A9P82_13235 [Arachidicoccus ginsenosidimutans]|uniref:POTRA domain-containing protein n=1 Tax=Arachidicoccus sp. BS20 TaxID=1850526 RepID=UPI0007F09BA7|nr:POTRA domain-containing protein [Arachidicoccus sp. BS20]ANI90163.1 hypothetical protein A9P82_13235 [Arachidicoccus sp. BS20]